jgi:hypothetical protein
MSSHHKFNQPAYEVHPEFGYLCSSDQLRQNVRVGLAAAAFGIIVGLVSAMVLFPRHGSDPARIESTLALAPRNPVTEAPSPRPATDAPAIPSPIASAAPPATAPSVPATTTAERAVPTDGVSGPPPPAAPIEPGSGAAKVSSTPSPAEADSPCKDETWPYFDSKCLWGPKREDGNEASPPALAPARAAPVVTARGTAAASQSEQRRAAASKKDPRTAKSSVRRRDPRAAFANGPFGFQVSRFGGRGADRVRYGRPRDPGVGWSW